MEEYSIIIVPFLNKMSEENFKKTVADVIQ
jgi:hypothetical protein